MNGMIYGFNAVTTLMQRILLAVRVVKMFLFRFP